MTTTSWLLVPVVALATLSSSGCALLPRKLSLNQFLPKQTHKPKVHIDSKPEIPADVQGSGSTTPEEEESASAPQPSIAGQGSGASDDGQDERPIDEKQKASTEGQGSGSTTPEESASAPQPSNAGQDSDAWEIGQDERPPRPPGPGSTAKVPSGEAQETESKPEKTVETAQKTDLKQGTGAGAGSELPPASRVDVSDFNYARREAAPKSWFPAQASVAAFFLFGEGADAGVGAYLGGSLGTPKHSTRDYSDHYSGALFSFGLDFSYLVSLREGACGELGCDNRITIGPAARLGYALGANVGSYPYPTSYFYLQATPFWGRWRESEGSRYGYGGRFSLGTTLPVWTALWGRMMGAIMDSGKDGGAAVIVFVGPVMSAIALLNHLEVTGEVAYDGEKANLRGGFLVGSGF